MKDIPLNIYCERHGQKAAADILGVTQGAISHMIKGAREIYIVVNGDDRDHYEIKRGKSGART